MSTRTTLVSLACAAALALSLGACGGPVDGDGMTNPDQASSTSSSPSSSAEAAATPTFTPSEFKLGSFSVKITSAEVAYDEYEESDALVFTLEATNEGSEDLAFGDTLNFAERTQGGNDLDWAFDLADVDDSYNTATAAGSGEALEPGASGTYTYALLLEGYDDPVVVTFQGYTSAVEETEVTFDVAGCESQEKKDAAAAAEKEAQDKADEIAGGEKKATVAGLTVELPDGWHFPSVTTMSATAKDADGNMIDLQADSQQADAAAWSEYMLAMYSSHTLENRTIMGVPAKYLELSEDSWWAWIDTSDGPVRISGDGVTLGEADQVLANATIA